VFSLGKRHHDTHAVSEDSRTKLWTRLRSHRGNRKGGGNHRGSIFRLRIGEALLQREGYADEVHETWGRGRNAPKNIRASEAPLEMAVSEYICRMPFLWVGVEDAASRHSIRAQLERNSIRLLSNYAKSPIDAPVLAATELFRNAE